MYSLFGSSYSRVARQGPSYALSWLGDISSCWGTLGTPVSPKPSVKFCIKGQSHTSAVCNTLGLDWLLERMWCCWISLAKQWWWVTNFWVAKRTISLFSEPTIMMQSLLETLFLVVLVVPVTRVLIISFSTAWSQSPYFMLLNVNTDARTEPISALPELSFRSVIDEMNIFQFTNSLVEHPIHWECPDKWHRIV